MTDAYLLAGVRTPIGKFLGSLEPFPAPELGAIAIRALLERTGVAPGEIEEVIMGNVITAGLGQAPARQAALKGGLPPTVPALTVNKVCGSGLKAVALAVQAIKAGDAQLVIAGGQESMSRAPHLATDSRRGWKMGEVKLQDAMITDGLWCAFHDCHMGMHAEHIARKYQVTRADQDEFAAMSQQRAGAALESGIFQPEIVPVQLPGKQAGLLSRDEGPRPDSTVQKLAGLRTVFDASGTVTAGNASTLSDGAAALLVASSATAKRFPTLPQAKILAYHTSGTAPEDLFIAPAFAIQSVLKKAGLTLADIDLFEINEAFAAQMVACLRELKLSPEKVNVHGGAIALGHPIGASGARILVTLLHALHAKNLRYGVASLCLGGGNAVAMVISREVGR